MKQGIVVLAHGSRSDVAGANGLLLEIVELVKQRGLFNTVKHAYMNPQSPGPHLQEAVEDLIQAGFDEIIVAPWFLTNGLHIQQDIPEILEGIKCKYPGLKVRLAKPLGADSRLADIIIDRIKEAVGIG